MKAKGKGGDERPTDGARIQKDDVRVAGPKEMSVVFIENSVAPSSVVNTRAPAEGVRSMQVTGDVWSQQSTSGGMVRQIEEGCKDA